MFNLTKVFVFLFLISCTAGNIKSEDDNKISEYLPECAAGCSYLATLKDVDGELGCTQIRFNGEECKMVCAKKLATGNKIVNPKCWQTLKSCNDFEEVCNFGELYP